MPSLYPNDYRSVIAILVRKRKDKHITQVQLASAMRVPQSFISKVERCERRLDFVELVRLCELIGVPFSEIINAIPPRFTPPLDSAIEKLKG